MKCLAVCQNELVMRTLHGVLSPTFDVDGGPWAAERARTALLVSRRDRARGTPLGVRPDLRGRRRARRRRRRGGRRARLPRRLEALPLDADLLARLVDDPAGRGARDAVVSKPRARARRRRALGRRDPRRRRGGGAVPLQEPPPALTPRQLGDETCRATFRSSRWPSRASRSGSRNRSSCPGSGCCCWATRSSRWVGSPSHRCASPA